MAHSNQANDGLEFLDDEFFSWESKLEDSLISQDDMSKSSNEKIKKLSKKEQKEFLKQLGEEYCLFGNRLVKKGTPEYMDLRVKNRKAVEEFRKKEKELNKIKEEKIASLAAENQELEVKIETLSKELDFLRELIIKKIRINVYQSN